MERRTDGTPPARSASNFTASSQAGSVLAMLAQGDRMGALADRVKELAVGEFIFLMDFITAEFQQYIRALDLIENEALETLLEQLLDAFTLKIGQVLAAEHTLIFLVDEKNEQLWAKGTEPQNNARDIRLPLNRGILGHVVITGEGVNVPHAQTHPLFDRDVDDPLACGAASILCMPVFSTKHPDCVVAVVQLIDKTDGSPFSDRDEIEFRSLAESIGIILESCQSFYAAARNQRGLRALLKATTTLGKSLALETTLQAVMEQARGLMQADRSTIFLLSRETNELWTKVAKADGHTMMEVRIPANKGIVGYVAATGETLNIADVYHDPRFDPTTDRRTGYETRNILCMPMYNASGEIIGVTQLINKYKGSFTESDEEFLRAFNAQAGIALENAQLFEKVMLEKQYQKDILESLSDAVISTDMQGRIVTINEAAMALMGCPMPEGGDKTLLHLWEQQLTGQVVWNVLPLDSLQWRLRDSLTVGARHYVPEQSITVCLCQDPMALGGQWMVAMKAGDRPDYYFPWGDTGRPPILASGDCLREVERSLNLTVSPLTNPEGGVRGGLVVLEDISREKRMKSTMYRYMTPGVVERIMAQGEDSLMVGERKEVTILFSDIRGYTTLAESLGAAKVVALLNQYFETMVEAVFNYEGTLDKFIGDALMAVFGAPLPLQENHGWMAVQSALDMRHRLREFNQHQLFEGQPLIRIGIGISSGAVVSGNIGSKRRMDYTVIGDGVNLSSRLESATKEYFEPTAAERCHIILSETTYQLCGEKLWVRELDKVRVKGQTQAVSIYQLVDRADNPLSPEWRQFLEVYEKGRHAYLARDFRRAIAAFERALAMHPGDRATIMHLERASRYLEQAPPDTWDGVHTMMVK